jgi:hypothetical protein
VQGLDLKSEADSSKEYVWRKAVSKIAMSSVKKKG